MRTDWAQRTAQVSPAWEWNPTHTPAPGPSTCICIPGSRKMLLNQRKEFFFCGRRHMVLRLHWWENYHWHPRGNQLYSKQQSGVLYFFFLRAASNSSLNQGKISLIVWASFSPLITQSSSILLQVHYENEYESSLAFNRPIWTQVTNSYKKALILVLLSLRKTTANNNNTDLVVKESNLPLMEGKKKCTIFLFIMSIM